MKTASVGRKFRHVIATATLAAAHHLASPRFATATRQAADAPESRRRKADREAAVPDKHDIRYRVQPCHACAAQQLSRDHAKLKIGVA
ncbi:hypothetical protein MRX96_049700 [Rhipicephalus microplus]